MSYYLSISKSRADDLAAIRCWSNLKLGTDGDLLWLKDFDYAQIHSVTVRSIPFKSVYAEKEGQLMLLDHLLTDRRVPNVLWTPIERALAVTLPDINHNYFSIEEQIAIQFAPTGREKEGAAMITPLLALQHYITNAPALRLQNIRWVILDTDRVLLLGQPFLPLPGEVYWQRKDFLLPAGTDFNLPVLIDVMHRQLNPERDHWLIWHADATFTRVPKTSLMRLSRSSVRYPAR